MIRCGRVTFSWGLILKKLVILMTALATALSISVAFSGEISDRATEAEKLLQSDNPAGALQKFRQAEDALWKAMPLTASNFQQVESASGFGIYTSRSSHLYKPKGTVALYMEPVGYGYGSDGLGNNQIMLSIDISIFSSSGEKIITMKNIARAQIASHERNREMYIVLNVTLGDIPPGKYRADVVLHDEVSKKEASFPTDFEVAGES